MLEDYDPDTRAADSAFGDLLNHIDGLPGLAGRTLLVLHSDHGQAPREHGIFGHGHDLYEESVRIPMILRLPGEIPGGAVVETLARNVDIAETVLDYLGLPQPPGLDGRSLRPAILGQAQPDVPAYMEMLDGDRSSVQMALAGEYFGVAEWHGVRYGPWKYLTVSMTPPCVRNPVRYGRGMLGINPWAAVGGEHLEGNACSGPRRQDLYPVRGSGYVPESFADNRVGFELPTAADYAERVDRVTSQARERTPLDLDREQQDKLKSLGYLQ